MTGKSLTPNEILLSQLKELMPQAFNEGKLDKEKLLVSLGENIDISNERYVLNWAGKSDCFRVLQSPSSRTLVPAKEESINFDETENIFIEGENLEVLKILQKSYFGKIKMIYIDPPYNTGNDSFIYPDKFSEGKDEYLKRVGDKDEEGYMTKEGMFRKNSKENGQYHSNWLSMMYPRLFLARNLLRDDGVIFVSIDDNEVHNLRLMMNEIFGEENFIGILVLQTATDNNPTQIKTEHEYIVCYVKNKQLQPFWTRRSETAQLLLAEYLRIKKDVGNNPIKIQEVLRKWIKDNDSKLLRVTHYDNVDTKGVFHDGDIANTKFGGYQYDVIHPTTGKACKIPDKGFRFPEETMKKMIDDGEIVFGSDETILIKPKKRLENVKDALRSIIYEDGRTSTKVVESLLDRDVFKNPKSHFILSRLVEFCSDKNDIILDFFAGSSSTAHAVLSLNNEIKSSRKFIMVQMPELVLENDKDSIQCYNFLKSNKLPATLAEVSKERIRRVISKIKEEESGKLGFEDKKLDLGFKVLKLADSSFKQWRTDIKTEDDLKNQMKLFTDPTREGSTPLDMVYELILKSGKDINSSIVHKNNVYYINDTELAILIEKVDGKTIDALVEKHPDKVIILDKLFKGNDSLKTNTALQMKDAGIEFKTI